MTVRRRLSHDAANSGQEAHVSHAVGFVNDHGAAVVEVECALFEHVFEAAGAGNDDVNTHVEGLARNVVGGAAVDGDDATTAVLGQVGQFLLDLSSELTGRNEDEANGLAGAGLGDVGEQWQAKGHGLSRSGRGLADDVASG